MYVYLYNNTKSFYFTYLFILHTELFFVINYYYEFLLTCCSKVKKTSHLLTFYCLLRFFFNFKLCGSYTNIKYTIDINLTD